MKYYLIDLREKTSIIKYEYKEFLSAPAGI